MRKTILTAISIVFFVVISHTDQLQQAAGTNPPENVVPSRRPTIPPVSEEELKRVGKTRLYLAGFGSFVIEVVDPVSGHDLNQSMSKPCRQGLQSPQMAADCMYMMAIEKGSF